MVSFMESGIFMVTRLDIFLVLATIADDVAVLTVLIAVCYPEVAVCMVLREVPILAIPEGRFYMFVVEASFDDSFVTMSKDINYMCCIRMEAISKIRNYSTFLL